MSDHPAWIIRRGSAGQPRFQRGGAPGRLLINNVGGGAASAPAGGVMLDLVERRQRRPLSHTLAPFSLSVFLFPRAPLPRPIEKQSVAKWGVMPFMGVGV